jgi:hypothetical protein
MVPIKGVPIPGSLLRGPAGKRTGPWVVPMECISCDRLPAKNLYGTWWGKTRKKRGRSLRRIAHVRGGIPRLVGGGEEGRRRCGKTNF